tara:strand:- start:45 stop:680 length:636 start_codon:yes stop_codon:yes gene_type:complete
MGKIKAVLFDMDGVLIDARDWHYEALNRALDLFGYKISRYDHLVTYDGLPTKVKLKMLTKERGLPEGLHSFINNLKQDYTMEIVYSHCKPVYHIEYALSVLSKSGIRLACCSNAVRSSVVSMMDRSNLSPYLDFILSNQDVTAPKPSPDIYNLAIQKMGFSPSECVVVEDNVNGITAAREAGAHVLEVASPKEVTISNIKEFIEKVEKGME